MTRANLRSWACALGLLAATAGPAPAGEEWASAVVERPHSTVRLVAGPDLADGGRLVGLHIALDPGWHTYWRNPGDSGVPPAFDWSGSGNLAGAVVRWPAPRALTTAYGISIGYEREVVFPVRIAAGEDRAPVDLALSLDYAVCAEVCIPLTAELALTLPQASPPPQIAALVAEYDAQVPPRQASGAPGPAVVGSRAESRAGATVLVIQARARAPASAFVEGPDKYYFAVAPAAEAGDGADGLLSFAVEVDGAAAPGDLSGVPVTATIVAADGAVEHSWIIQ